MKKHMELFILPILFIIYSCNNNINSVSYTNEDSLIIAQKFKDSSEIAFQGDDYFKSLYFLNLSLSFNPNDLTNYDNRINLYYKFGLYDKALNDCDIRIQKLPADDFTYFIYYIKASSLFKLQKHEEALLWYDKTIYLTNKIDSMDLRMFYFDRYVCRKMLKDKNAFKDSIKAYEYGYGLLTRF